MTTGIIKYDVNLPNTSRLGVRNIILAI